MLRSRGRGRGGSGGAWYFQDKADGVDPTLNLDFINNRYAVNGVEASFSGVFTFTRASIGTYYDSSGVLQTATADTPRFDYDPVTHAPKGILIEEARTNLCLQSSELSTSPWAPNGSLYSGETLLSLGMSAYTRQDVTLSSSTTYTFSTVLKAGTNNWAYLYFRNKDSSDATAYIDLQNGVLGTVTVGTATIKNVGNGYYRVSLTHTSGTGATQAFVQIQIASANGSTVITSGNTILAKNCQLEVGAFLTSYIPTTTAAVTRAADVLTIPTGAWYNNNQSTLSLSANAYGGGGSFQIGIGTNSNDYLGFPYLSPDKISFGVSYYVASGVPKVIGSFSLSIGTPYVAAYTFDAFANVSSYASNGILRGNRTDIVPLSSANFLQVGRAPYSASYVTGVVKNIKYYPVRVSDTELQRITT